MLYNIIWTPYVSMVEYVCGATHKTKSSIVWDSCIYIHYLNHNNVIRYYGYTRKNTTRLTDY